MYTFALLAQNLKSEIDVKKIFTSIFENAINQQWIINTIRERIYNKGVDSSGGTIRTDKAVATGRPFYAESTEKRKKKKLGSLKNVNLTESGDTLKHLKLKLNNESIEIYVDDSTMPYYTYVGLNFRIATNGETIEQSFFTFTDWEHKEFMNRIFIPQFRKLLKEQFKQAVRKTI